ncbi:hypothetical protein [Humibacter ginsenosidimutans]|uniref:Uncharacterized protein n=1 Tax=Humibacter ginsenosidimutans TaxID=2599293 RepID=A0A5B8M9F8_9MICO|nr:hypothetical protein [Humibacter ginsenosidimutans]QDZ16295.1 hypothetical protein FPZ11_17415 [Humibacter ginsenosidimutans]
MSSGEVTLYDAGGGTQMQMHASEGTLWSTPSEMADLWGNALQHIGQIMRRMLDDDATERSTTKRDFVVRREGAANAQTLCEPEQQLGDSE